MHKRDVTNHFLGPYRPAQPPARHAHHLRKTRNDYRLVIELGNRGGPLVEIKLSINFVREYIRIRTRELLGDEPQIIASDNAACGIRRGIDDDQFRPACKRARETFAIKCKSSR